MMRLHLHRHVVAASPIVQCAVRICCLMWWFYRKGPSGFSGASTAEEVTAGVDGRGLVAVITGASSGIGLETARVLAMRGVHVVMAVRNVSAGLAAQEAIAAKIPGARMDVLELDLSSMASVRRFASEFESLNLPLNILINNAGVMTRYCKLSCDGLELHFATNHIGHFLLTNLLLENMKNSCRDSGVEGRIVNLTSSGHFMTYPEGICFDKIHDPSGLNDFIAYGQSKLANILHCNELSRILKEEGMNTSANAVHPGVITTNLFRDRTIVSVLLNSIGKIICRSVEQGAATTCYVAMHPQIKGLSGKYFANCNIGSPSSQASDPELAKKLWQFSLQTVSS
ncbi:short-chain dehydrogenase TIC 32, chloroplastic-like isoform X2 [Panicum virgatum]|nr:short-chain dehydrogenase TIC 32, chloroplastic-like isoform X2 [Panicum virgatum]